MMVASEAIRYVMNENITGESGIMIYYEVYNGWQSLHLMQVEAGRLPGWHPG